MFVADQMSVIQPNIQLTVVQCFVLCFIDLFQAFHGYVAMQNVSQFQTTPIMLIL